MEWNKGNKISCTHLTQNGGRIMAYITKKESDDNVYKYYIRLPKPSIVILENNYIDTFEWHWYNCCIHRPGLVQLSSIQLCETMNKQYRQAVVSSKDEKCYICSTEKEVNKWPCKFCTAADPIKTMVGKIAHKQGDSHNKHGARCGKPKCVEKVGLPKSRSRQICITSQSNWQIIPELTYRKFCAESAIQQILTLLILRRRGDKNFKELPKGIIKLINMYTTRFYRI